MSELLARFAAWGLVAGGVYLVAWLAWLAAHGRWAFDPDVWRGAVTRPEPDPDPDDDWPAPYGAVSWKSTSVCMTLVCECGATSHVCGWFAYSVMCPDCGVVYAMQDRLALVPYTPSDDDLVFVDTDTPIIVAQPDGTLIETGALTGDDMAKPWRELKHRVPYKRAREQEGIPNDDA